MRNAVSFWQTLESFGSSIALIEPNGRTISYEELAGLCDTAGSPFRGCARGLVLIGLENSTESIVRYLAALRSGHAVLIADACNTGLWANLQSAYAPEFIVQSSTSAIVQSSPSASRTPPHAELAILLTTSGSTGGQKCVRLSADGIQRNACSIAEYLELTSSERALLTLPLHYSYGLSVLHSHLAVGASLVTGLNSMASSAFVELLKKNQATSFATVPYSFEMLERMDFREKELPKLRYVTQAGGRLAPQLVERYGEWAEKSGKRFYVMYGQTEAGPRISWLPPHLARSNASSIGIPIPGGQLSVVDADGADIKTPNIHGELVFRGPSVMFGYALCRDDLDRGREVDQLKTGDIGYFNEDGLFFIAGRSARFAKLYGKRFNLDEAEGFLRSLSQREAVCVSNDKHLFVVTTMSPLDSDSLTRFIERFGFAAEDVHAVQLQSLPRFSSGKLNYPAILSKAESVASPHSDNHEQLTKAEAVLAVFQRTFPKQEVRPGDSFVRLGGGSLSYVAASVALEKVLGRLPPDWETLSIRQLIELKEARPQDAKSAFSWLETSILFRGLAPVLIVLYHSGVGRAAGGAFLLLVVLGLNFARFQLADVVAGNVRKVVVSTLTNILIPYWLLVGAYQLHSATLALPEFILADNFLGGHTHTPFPTWFIQAAVQCMVIACVFVSIAPLRNQFIKRPLICSMIGFAVSAMAFVLAPAPIPVEWNDNGWRLTWVIWLFVLGIAIYQCRTVRDRCLVSVVAVVAATAFLYYQSWSRVGIVTLGVLMLLWVPQIRAPKWMVKPCALLASASMFIYMLHPVPISRVPNWGWLTYVADAAIGVTIGVLGWWLYNWICETGITILKRYALRLRAIFVGDEPI